MDPCGHVSPVIYLRSAKRSVCRACFEEDCAALLLVGDYSRPPRCPSCGLVMVNYGGFLACHGCGETSDEPAFA